MAKRLLLTLLLVLFSLISVIAQTDSFTGYMGDDVSDEIYPVTLQTGQTITASTVATSGNLDTIIGLRRKGEEEYILINDDRDSTTLDSFLTYTATESGDYEIIVSNIEQTSGEYALRIEVTEAPAGGERQSYEGYMGDDVADERYPVELEAGQVIMVTAVAASDNLDTYIGLEDAGGEIVVQNDDRDNTTLDSFFTYTAPVSGTYTVIMSNIERTSGNYVLTIEVMQATASPVPAGDVYTGFMSDDVPDDLYPVQLEPGQMLTVVATATSGDLDTYIGIQNPKGDVVAENDDRDGTTLNSYLQYTAPTSGIYTVVMSNIRKTSGDYELTISISGEMVLEEAEAPEDSEVVAAPIPAETFTGYMGADVSDNLYTIQLAAGQAVIVSSIKDNGDLDPYLILENADGDRVAQNDDRDETTFDAEMGFIAAEAGEYTIVMTNVGETSGDYTLTIAYVTPEEAEASIRERLSGPVQIIETENFRVHYTTEGMDATTDKYAETVAATMEEVREIQINQLGWPIPPTDGVLGGDDKYDVYLLELLNNPSRGELGFASPELPSADNPFTPLIEAYAVPSYLALDNDYAEASGDPAALMRATAAHEFHHAIQFGYDYGEEFTWYYEATAVWMETVTLPVDQDATGYVSTNFSYPEICFGADGDADPADGIMKYGEWLFMQSIADAHGDLIVRQLWENIANFDKWEPLEETLAIYGETIPDAVRRYRMQNLVRDYALTPEFDESTVWMEGVIDAPGSEWIPTGKGIQELGANYYELALADGVYNVSIDTAGLELWAIGITEKDAVAIPLGSGGTVDTGQYQYVYLMVFQPIYDEDIESCAYYTYRIDVQPGSGTPTQAVMTLNAAQFKPLQ